MYYMFDKKIAICPITIIVNFFIMKKSVFVNSYQFSKDAKWIISKINSNISISVLFRLFPDAVIQSVVDFCASGVEAV